METWTAPAPAADNGAERAASAPTDPHTPVGTVATVEFDYDAFGRRVAKRSAAGETRYAWDGLRLALELDASRAAPWEYHYKDQSFEPLCRTREGSAEFFAGDQIGVPQEVLNGRGEPVWRGTLTPYGSVTSETGFGRAPPFRLIGQYADRETGLSYNGARYYDPSLGRYITPDPIGILGAPDTYAYASDPLALVDPWALYIVALGRTSSPGNPTLLKDFAAAHPPAVTWGSVPNLPSPADAGWGQWTRELIGNSEGARFNLNEIPDVKAAFERGAQLAETEAMLMQRGLPPGYAQDIAHVTDVELYQLLRRDGPLDDRLKKFFDKDGNEVDIETLRKQCGI